MQSHKVYDLHCHSNQSDGILSPEALVSRAKANDVSVIALTDHDTISGLERARAQATIEGLELVNGIEFSTIWAGRNIHVVALAFDECCERLLNAIDEQAEARQMRARHIGERLAKAGLDGVYENALELANGAALGRPHFAKAMVSAGYVKSIDQAFKRYLGAGKIGDVKQHWPMLGDIVDVIRSAGGVAVLAHPLKYKITRTKLISLVSDFEEAGGRAIEVVSGLQRPQETRDVAKIADKFELLSSTGSDFHAPNAHWAELGKASAFPEYVSPVWQLWES